VTAKTPPCSKRATLSAMRRRITQRELRNDSGRIMRALDRGKAFIVTRNGRPVGELVPLRQRAFVPSEFAHAAFAGAPAIARRRFRTDVDAFLDQTVTLRG
jgi:prevent-host-death family protein